MHRATTGFSKPVRSAPQPKPEVVPPEDPVWYIAATSAPITSGI